MRIQMLTLYAGPAGVRDIGKVYDVPTAEAKDLIAGGFALAASKAEPEPETPEPGDAEASEGTPPRPPRRRSSTG